MPKLPAHALVWRPESASYELWTQGRQEYSFQASEEARWLAWLETHLTFSFRGQKGSLNALKENRQRGSGYWYGYKGLEKRTVKRYLGPTARVTLARLEAVASEFEQARAFAIAHPLAAEDDPASSRPVSDIFEPGHTSSLPSLSLKFRLPRLRERLVERPRLVQLLDDGQSSGLTLLSAPAGFGKTTLVSQWLASSQKEGLAVAWISLDERDNDIVRFWRCVVGACQGMPGERSQTVLAQLTALERSPSLLEEPVLELILTTFLNELAAVSGCGIIVLEDYQFITISRVHTSLAFWLEHLPANQRVIMITRHDPPLPLAQWRVRGLLYEIRSRALRFTPGETASFFQRHCNREVSRADMVRLLDRTEGWIAGLQLAVLVLNAQGTDEGVGSAFQCTHRYIVDYLVQEVLDHLPENVQLFLQQTSLLERLQSRLCEAVTEQSEGQRMLEWLERANLFLVPLDETHQWYRYHHLFREVLLQRLAQNPPEVIAELHRRAARWFLREQMAAEAVTHAYAAKDFATLADSIEQSQAVLLQQGENATLASWINLLPQAVLFERPPIFVLACMENMAADRTQVAAELLNAYAHRHHLPAVGTRNVDELERALCGHAGQLFPHQQNDSQRRAEVICGLLGLYATLVLVMERNVALYQQIRQRSERYVPSTGQRRQESWFAALLQGDVQGAIADLMKSLNESMTRPEDAVLFTHIYPTLTLLLMTTGQLQLIESVARQMLQRKDTLDARLNHGPALIDLGRIAYERNQLDQAEASIQAGLPLCQYPGFEAMRYRGLLVLAKTRRAQGNREAAWTVTQELEMELSRNKPADSALNNWRGLLAWEALNLGDEKYAWLWMQDNPMPQDIASCLSLLSADGFLMQAFFLLHFGRRAEAEMLLSELSGWTRQNKLHGLLIPVLALQAILAQARGESTQAEMALKEALVLARSSGYVRTLLDLSEGMQELLLRLWNGRHAKARHSSVRYLEWLFASVRDDGTGHSLMESAFSQPLIEPLSRREREVLREIDEGYSNEEIARRLVISSSTVKSHINNIYRKLQTKSRTQAIARARTLNLLSN